MLNGLQLWATRAPHPAGNHLRKHAECISGLYFREGRLISLSINSVASLLQSCPCRLNSLASQTTASCLGRSLKAGVRAAETHQGTPVILPTAAGLKQRGLGGVTQGKKVPPCHLSLWFCALKKASAPALLCPHHTSSSSRSASGKKTRGSHKSLWN